MGFRNRSVEKAEYEAVLASGIFPPESNPARFLECVCEKYFQGKSTLSEYAIAVEGLGRRQDFDPKQDAIVRVEAHRVRKRLSEYYEHEGRDHPIRIEIPAGHYLPVFVSHHRLSDATQQASAPIQETPDAAERLRFPFGKRGALLGTVLLVAVIVGGLLLVRQKESKSRAQQPMLDVSAPAAVSSSETEVRIMAGSSAKDYTDRLGRVWFADRYYNGGEARTIRYRKIFRTADPQLFLTARQGIDFGYDIPLKPGHFELRLYFAETDYGEDNSEGGGESSRIFSITANDAPLLSDFDPLSDAGGSNTADVRVFKGLSPATDGRLHLRFTPRWALKAVPFVNAIELVPGKRNAMLPIRWVASDSARVDSHNRLWLPDQFCYGGRLRLEREVVTGADDPELYRSQRYGNFNYAIPVAEGTYSLTLYFAEHWFGIEGLGGSNGTGLRVFDVYCSGTALLRKLDIARETGAALRALRKTFHGLRPDAQGKLLLTFVPIKDYATLNALEVLDENDN